MWHEYRPQARLQSSYSWSLSHIITVREGMQWSRALHSSYCALPPFCKRSIGDLSLYRAISNPVIPNDPIGPNSESMERGKTMFFWDLWVSFIKKVHIAFDCVTNPMFDSFSIFPPFLYVYPYEYKVDNSSNVMACMLSHIITVREGMQWSRALHNSYCALPPFCR